MCREWLIMVKIDDDCDNDRGRKCDVRTRGTLAVLRPFQFLDTQYCPVVIILSYQTTLLDTHSISRLPYFSLSSLICLIPGFQAGQTCQKRNFKFYSSTSTSAINFTYVFNLIAHLCSRLSKVCSNRSCSLLLRPCFPDYCRDKTTLHLF